MNTPNGIPINPNRKYVKPKIEVPPDELIPYPLLKELIFSGVRFYYESYDHKEALEEMRQIYPNNNIIQMANVPVPREIQANHIVWRIGKLRAIAFAPDGRMSQFKIGNRYYKTYFRQDFGIKVKPMIFKSDDVTDLIGQGLAVADTL